MLEGRDAKAPQKKTFPQWIVFQHDTEHFSPGQSEFMINYRVDDLEEMVRKLHAEGVRIIGDIQVYSYGKFAHFIDCDGRKVELWEPADDPFG